MTLTSDRAIRVEPRMLPHPSYVCHRAGLSQVCKYSGPAHGCELSWTAGFMAARPPFVHLSFACRTALPRKHVSRTMTPSSPYITPYPGLSTVSASIVERFRRCGATPQIQFPIGHLYSDERALDFEEAKLREAATLAWKMLCNEFSLKILSSALGPRLLDDDGNAHIDSEIEERVKRWLSGNDCSIVIQRALDEGIWGYCSRDSYMELNISEQVRITRIVGTAASLSAHIQLLGYLTREETSSSLRATAVFALTIANAAVSSMRMSLVRRFVSATYPAAVTTHASTALQ